MRVDWNKKYTTIAVYSLIVIILSITFYLCITNYSKFSDMINTFFAVLRPFIVGFSLAYLLNFVMAFYEKNIVEKIVSDKKPKIKRALSLILTYVTLTIVLMLFMKFVLPQVTESVARLINDFPKLVNKVYLITDQFVKDIDLPHSTSMMINQKINEFGKNAIDFATNLMPLFANVFLGILKSVWNTVLGLIVSIYILADKEGFAALCKKFLSAIFSVERSERLLYITRFSNDIFGKFIVGKIIDSTIIAFITFIVLSITGMPYKILLTFIIGTTNIIPFFGPFIGAIPSVFIVLMIDPIKAFWLLIIIFVIQQLDGNVIGPKILGDSIGISSFWILFSLLIAGKFFGLIGMIVGVPLFAITYTIIGESVNSKLKKKGLPTSKEEYK